MEWPEVNKWRRETRNEILVARLARPLTVRKATRDRIVEHLGRDMPWLGRDGFGFYWPFRGELDLREFAASATRGSRGCGASRGRHRASRYSRPRC